MYDSYAEIFSERAAAYHRAMVMCPHARAAEFEAVCSPLLARGAKRVCDIPAGGGYLSAFLPKDCCYTAVEPAADFARECRDAVVVQAKLSEVPLPSASFDGVVSLAGLHHEPDKLPVLKEFRRLVDANGICVVADVAAGTAAAHFLNGYVDRHSSTGHKGHFLDEDFDTLLAEAGMNVLADETVLMPWRFPSRRAAGRYSKLLFGLNVTAAEVEAELATTIGFTVSSTTVYLNWSLRKVVCEPNVRLRN
ncbi:MAG TPA: class I SAM-dependent methyltransferase [Sphingomicrobium sp.]|jgi:SAM-dependent methyltransferase